jgi:ribosome recycling factor
MNRSDYETEVHDELKDNGTYKEIKEDLTTKIENKIKKNVDGMYKRCPVRRFLKF